MAKVILCHGLEKIALCGLPNIWVNMAHYLVYTYSMVVPVYE
ncbi:MAG: hypothetical protein PHT33_14795 [bacterium]|nr:hypothetical protein [bacterium]